MKRILLSCTLLMLASSVGLSKKPLAKPPTTTKGLRDATVLIVRHAEKQEPPGGGLTPAGEARAKAYAHYFRHCTAFAQPVQINHLFASADHDNNTRARQTIEPLSKAIGLPIDLRFKNNDFESLAREIKAGRDGKQILISWHHGKIPELLNALGADPAKLLPQGTWPENVFCWVIELHYDHGGKLSESVCVNEDLMPGDSDYNPPQ